MEDPTLYPSVLEHFPEWSERIPQLLHGDANFNEMCGDYEELARWLAAHSHDGTPECACVENRQLLAELDAEILAALQATERQTRSGANQSISGGSQS